MIASALTGRQRECLSFIVAYARDKGHAPSFDEMMEALGLHSKSNVHRLIHALAERGFIEIRPNRARAITVLVEPPRVEIPLISAWRSATEKDRQDLLFLIGAQVAA